MTHYGIEMPYLTWMALCGIVWSFCCFLRPSTYLTRRGVALFGLVWPHYGLTWSIMAEYRLLWQNIVFSRGHRSKFSWSCLNQTQTSASCVSYLKTLRFVSFWISALTSILVEFKACGQIFVCPAIGLSRSDSCWQCAAYATVSASVPVGDT